MTHLAHFLVATKRKTLGGLTIIAVAATATACSLAMPNPPAPAEPAAAEPAAAEPAEPGVTVCEVNATVFAPHCASCHNGTGALDLRANALGASLVGIPSSSVANAERVVAGNAAASLLFRKMSNTVAAGEGGVMPPAGQLQTAHVELVREWIEGGASMDCVLPQPTGDSCENASECASGICIAGVCAETPVPACVEVEDACFSDGDCCAGFCALAGEIYGPGSCSPLLVDGEFCAWDTECVSNACVNNTCTSECATTEGACDFFGPPCCAGLVCLGVGPYAPGECSAPQPPGMFCEADPECASSHCVEFVCSLLDDGATCAVASDCSGGVCHDGQCRSTCAESDQECSSFLGGAGCCSGVCHETGYGFGTCGPPGVPGDGCWAGNECASGICTDYQCI